MPDYRNEIENLLQESSDVKTAMKVQSAVLNQIVHVIVEAYQAGKKVIIFGNGGSAADAQHIAAEFVSRFFLERKALPCIALNVNTSILTALGNDYGFDSVFRRQLEAIMQSGDIVIGISTSGNSPNVIQAIEYAKIHGGKTIALVGAKPCKLDLIAQIVLKVPSSSTPRIQEAHITAGHIIAYLVERELFPDKSP